MANVLSELFQNTANAIREKTGSTGTMKPMEFPEKIRSITVGEGGEPAELIPISITENGVYEPTEADGFSQVTVDVTPKLSVLSATENGTYYPRENIEHGKTYTLRNDFTQTELRSFYEASLGRSEDGMYAYLCAVNGEMFGIMYAYDYYGVYITDGEFVHLWIPKEIANAMGFDSGWNFGTDYSDLATAAAPSVSFETYELMIEGGLSALNGLFDLPVTDGFSEVTVAVPKTVPVLEELEITENGIYEPSEADGYSKVTVNVEGSGNGAAAGAHTLTFLNHDQSILYEKQTFDGDDSFDPVSAGKISKPKKESTAQYHYTYSGWSATDGGTVTSGVLKNIKADKTLYTVFTSQVRSYTVKFYDSDGTTILYSNTYNYGETPSYMPEKSGHSFVAWTPAVTPVTGDMSYTATWAEKVSFYAGMWADIARISESGEARKHFKIGDKRNISYNGYNMELMIVGFDHDDLADGSGKAGMTVIFRNVTDFKGTAYTDGGTHAYLDGTTHNLMMDPLPDDLKAIMKTVTKPFAPEGFELGIKEPLYKECKVFALSFEEMNLTHDYTEEKVTKLGTCYEYFANNKLSPQQVFPCTTNSNSSYPVWARGTARQGTGNSRGYLFIRSQNGYTNPQTGYFTPSIAQLTYECYYKAGFCI